MLPHASPVATTLDALVMRGYETVQLSLRRWEAAMKTEILEQQHRDGSFCELKGSWDPVGAGAEEGGRAFMTFTCALSLEIWYRLGEVLGVPGWRDVTQPKAAPTPNPPPDESTLPRRRYSRCP